MAQYDDDEAFLTDDDGGYDEPAPRRSGRRLEPHRGTLILVLGILSIVVCPITGIFSWVMGNEDMRKIRDGRMDPEGEGLTQAGRILGMIGCTLVLISILLFGLVMCGTVMTAGSSKIEYEAPR